ncbi:MAG TPA: hypothetical protein VLA89_07825 [Gemmatimonadales bacterium]|nr:hypothetical protein [Gemmatimonadales bacterium]
MRSRPPSRRRTHGVQELTGLDPKTDQLFLGGDVLVAIPLPAQQAPQHDDEHN